MRGQSPANRIQSPASRSRSTSVSSRASEKQENQNKSGSLLYSKVSECVESEVGSPVKERKIFCCHICPYKTIEGTNINRHVKAHQPRPGAGNVCDYCPFYARSSGAVKNHERVLFKADDVDERILVKGYNADEMAKMTPDVNEEEEEEDEEEEANAEEESSDESEEEEVGLFYKYYLNFFYLSG